MNVVTVLIDSPRNKNLVPTKWHSRNTKLKTSYNIRGFPTYLLLDSNLKILGKLGAGRNKTASSFSAEVRALLPRSSSSPITNITTTTTTSTSKSGVVWEFEDGNSGSENWIKYLPQDATILENAFISKKSTVQVTNKYGTYSITLPSGAPYGSQVKQGSGFQRRVRRHVIEQSKKKITFEWFDGSSWIEYAPNLQRIIQSSFQRGDRYCKLSIGTNMYDVDFGTSKQRNTKTNVFRPIRRRTYKNNNNNNNNNTVSTKTDDDDDEDDDEEKSNVVLKADEMDCWNLIAPLRSKHNPILLTSNPVPKIVSTLKKQGKRFVDRSFPPVPKTANWNPSRYVLYSQQLTMKLPLFTPPPPPRPLKTECG